MCVMSLSLVCVVLYFFFFFFFQAEDGIRDIGVTGVQTCALPIFSISYAGNDQFQARTTSVPFVIAHEETTLAYRGDAALVNGVAAHLSAVLKIGRASCRERV